MAYRPNQIPRSVRILNFVLSGFLLTYGTFGMVRDDLYIFGKRGPGVHLHGWSAATMFLAMLCAAANMISVIVDHYDQRDNEHDYRLFAKVTQVAGWTLMAAAFAIAILVKGAATR